MDQTQFDAMQDIANLDTEQLWFIALGCSREDWVRALEIASDLVKSGVATRREALAWCLRQSALGIPSSRWARRAVVYYELWRGGHGI